MVGFQCIAIYNTKGMGEPTYGLLLSLIAFLSHVTTGAHNYVTKKSFLVYFYQLGLKIEKIVFFVAAQKLARTGKTGGEHRALHIDIYIQASMCYCIGSHG